MKAVGAALAVSLAVAAMAADQERTFERTLNVNGHAFLDLVTDAGGIVVTPGPPGTVRVRGILKPERYTVFEGNAEDKIRRLVQDPPVQQNGNSVKVGHVTDKSLLRGVSMRLEITAPPDSEVRASADSGGIRVSGVKGPVNCKTDSGGITVSGIGSDLQAAADSGGVRIRDVKGQVHVRADSGSIEALDIAGAIDVQTDSGGIRLSQTAPAPVRARADSGGVHLTLAASGGYDVKAEADSGRVSVPEMTATGTVSKNRAQGRVRGGGPLVDIRVDSGNVDIR